MTTMPRLSHRISDDAGCFYPHPQKTEQMMNGITHWQVCVSHLWLTVVNACD